MGTTQIGGGQINKNWTIAAGGGLVMTAAAVLTILFSGQNASGVTTFKELSDGSREMSGNLVIESGASAFKVDAANRRVGVRTNSPKVPLEIIGQGSGSSLYAASYLASSGTLAVRSTAKFYSTLTLNGVAYTFPFGDGSASGKVLKTNGAGQLAWSTDLNTGGGGGTYVNTGSLITVLDARHVKKQGDTMTGGLLIVNGGHTGLPTADAGVLLEIIGVGSGRTLHAQDQLSSSGTTVSKNALYIETTGSNPSIINPTTGNGLILSASGGGVSAQLRIVGNGNGWTDAVKLSYFQMQSYTNGGAVNKNVAFMGGTFAGDTVMDRLQFDSTFTQFTNQVYNNTPVPTNVLEVLNTSASTAVFKIKAASAQTADLINVVDSSGNPLLTLGKSGSGYIAGRLGVNTKNPKTQLEVQGTVSGSYITSPHAMSPVHFAVNVFGTGTSLAVGSGKLLFNPIPRAMSGYRLTDAYAVVDSAGTTGLTKLVFRDATRTTRLLSTPLSIGSGRTGSGVAFGGGGVIDTTGTPANNVVYGYDRLYLDISSVQSTPPKGLSLELEFSK